MTDFENDFANEAKLNLPYRLNDVGDYGTPYLHVRPIVVGDDVALQWHLMVQNSYGRSARVIKNGISILIEGLDRSHAQRLVDDTLPDQETLQETMDKIVGELQEMRRDYNRKMEEPEGWFRRLVRRIFGPSRNLEKQRKPSLRDDVQIGSIELKEKD